MLVRINRKRSIEGRATPPARTTGTDKTDCSYEGQIVPQIGNTSIRRNRNDRVAAQSAVAWAAGISAVADVSNMATSGRKNFA